MERRNEIEINTNQTISKLERISGMNKFNLDSSPLYESFEGLYIGDAVYSQTFGLGHIRGFYNDEIIVQFSNSRRRFSVEDKEIRKVPDNYFMGRGKKIKVSFEGKEMSYAEYKKMAGLTKKGKKEEKLKHVTLKAAADIFGISKAELFKSIAVNNIKAKTFGRNVMIHREDILKMNKIFSRNKKS